MFDSDNFRFDVIYDCVLYDYVLYIDPADDLATSGTQPNARPNRLGHPIIVIPAVMNNRMANLSSVSIGKLPILRWP